MAQVSLKNVSKIFPPDIMAVKDVNLGVENYSQEPTYLTSVLAGI